MLGKPDEMLGGNVAVDCFPMWGGGEGGVVILLIAPCYGNQDRLWLHEPLGASTDYYTLANGVTSERYNDCDCRS